MLFRFNDTHFPGVQVHFVSLKVPALIRAQPTGISHAEVSAEQERTEWLFWIFVCIDLPEKRRQFIVPKQIRNKNCSASGELIRQDVSVFSNGFQVSAKSSDKSGPAVDYASRFSRLRFQPVQDDAFCQLVI